jgi:signal transduction histidine kinase
MNIESWMPTRVANLLRALTNTLRPYMVALLAVVFALIVRAILHPVLQSQELTTFMAYTTFMVATAFSAWFLGWRPGLLAIGLGLFVGDFFFTPPIYSLNAFSRNELPETITYLVACGVFLLIGVAKQKSGALLVEKNIQIEAANARLREMSAHLLRAQDEEHRKIARDLHDSVGQYISAIGMSITPLIRRAKELPPDVPERLKGALEIVRACASEVRTISHLLHPPLLDEMGLSSAVRWYAEGFAARSNIQVDLDVSEDLNRFGADIELALFRVLQESLTNVHRHSGSKVAQVNVGADAHRVWLEVRDRGKGIPQKEGRLAFRPGIGTSGMQERMNELSGTLELTSDRTGTLVKAIIPLPAGPRNVKTERGAAQRRFI